MDMSSLMDLSMAINEKICRSRNIVLNYNL